MKQTVLGYGLVNSEVTVRFQTRQVTILSLKCPDALWGPSGPYVVGTGFFPGG
jgi:hypothetical protein